MRWSSQELAAEAPAALPGLARLSNFVRSVSTPEFAGMTFHEVMAKSALNRVPTQSDMPFGWTINPYRGCSHACAYCLDPETMILMADGRQKPLWQVRVGDRVYGTKRQGNDLRYVITTVHATWNTRKPAHRITLADGTNVVASGDHRFLTDRGWKHVTGAMSGPGARPHLTTNNTLMGFGALGVDQLSQPQFFAADYRKGYLTGMIRGDGHVGHYEHRRPVEAIRTSSQSRVALLERIIEWESAPSADWHAGFLAGIFDAEGSCSRGVLRISNSDEEILDQVCDSMKEFGIDHVLEPANEIGVRNVRVTGGRAMRQRFFTLTGPSISRKLSIEGMAVTSNARLDVVSIEDLGTTIDMIDITTGTGDFIANGVISHNCFARKTHEYLDLDAGKDFDSEIVVKVNVAEVLRRELAKPGWGHHPVALGTNTDPYQRAEGRYRLMPGIIAALADSGTPFSILTKGTLLRRDLPLLAEAATVVPVGLAMSIAIYDDELQQSVEPGTPSTAARLATVAAARELGLDCEVFMMPILPFLTDTRAHLDAALAQIRDAGATSVLYTALHLRPGTKEWFMLWLEREHPELVTRYRQLYGASAYAPKDYRRWLAAKISPMIRRYGLQHGEADPSTGSVRSKALARDRQLDAQLTLIHAELPSPLNPTLF